MTERIIKTAVVTGPTGAVGMALCDRLLAEGISQQALDRVHTPIGTKIRAVTPEEIAVSIAGEMICVRAEARDGTQDRHHPCPMHE